MNKYKFLPDNINWYRLPDHVKKLLQENGIIELLYDYEVDNSPATDAENVKEALDRIITNGTGGSIILDNALDVNSTNGVENQAIALAIQQILDVIAEPPTYVQPTTNLTNVTQTVETGTTLSNLTLDISFTQNDAGTANGFTLRRNGVVISNNQNNQRTESNITSTINFQGSVSYGQGVLKQNNLGIDDPTGRVQAGTINTPTRTLIPKLRLFWGTSASIPTNSTQVRNLPNNNAYENYNQIDLETGTTNTTFVVAIPSTKSVANVTDLGNLNANITSEYVLTDSNFTVQDIGGTNRNYKLYVMDQAIPYTTTTTHRITLS